MLSTRTLSATDAVWHQLKESVTCAQSAQISIFAKIVSVMEFMLVTAYLRLENQNMLQQNLSANTRTSRWARHFHLRSALSRKKKKRSQLPLKNKHQWQRRPQDIRLALSRRVSLTSTKFNQVLNLPKLGSSGMMVKLHGQLMSSSFRPLEMTLEQSLSALDTMLRQTQFAKSLSNARPRSLREDILPISECRQETSNSDIKSGVTSWSSSQNSSQFKWFHRTQLSKASQWK